MEDDKLLTERILILIRNILDIPATPDDDKRTDDDASVHDQVQLFPLSYRTHFRCTIMFTVFSRCSGPCISLEWKMSLFIWHQMRMSATFVCM